MGRISKRKTKMDNKFIITRKKEKVTFSRGYSPSGFDYDEIHTDYIYEYDVCQRNKPGDMSDRRYHIVQTFKDYSDAKKALKALKISVLHKNSQV